MQEPTEEAEEVEAPIPTEIVSSGPDENLNQTVNVRRKAAKRTHPWDLQTGELELVSPQPQAEDIPVTKKRRLEEPLPATTDEAASKSASPDVSVALPPPVADNDDVNEEPLMDAQPNTVATGRWTADEDAKLTSAVANTSKKKWGEEYKTDWNAVAALVPGRTKSQCLHRWKHALDPSIGRASGPKGKWTAVEDSKLKYAVKRHDGKNWALIASLIPGRNKNQCCSRWHIGLNSGIARTAGRTGKWAEDEDIKLKDAVQMHGDKDWVAVAALVPGRTINQCRCRWRDALDVQLASAVANTSKKKWGNEYKTDWDAFATLVPGRTKIQCKSRWQDVLNPSIQEATKRTGRWTNDEDGKLKDSVKMHGGKDWAAITALVPGRTKKQCCNRWHSTLDPSIVRTPPGRSGKWAEDEDITLKDAVQIHGGKDWVAVATLVPGRTINQCRCRWRDALDPSIDGANERTDK
jgi:uncharacterized protein (DUF2237 family)